MSPDAEEPASEEARPDARSLCPHCGAVCEPYQEYCLSCGERLLEAGAVATGLAERWRYLLPFSDGSWSWPVLVALAIAVLAATFAILHTQINQTKTLTELGPTVHPTTASTGTIAKTGTGTTAPVTTSRKPPKPPVDATGLIAWPGPPGYTIVLASIPISGGKASARQKALEALNAGLGDVGVLKSSEYSSLHPGYYVVFSGIFTSQSAAMRHIPAAKRAGFVKPYQKRVAS